VSTFSFNVIITYTQERCEVQFDYGLKQGKSLPVSKRLTSFQTDKGKTINVNTDVAVSNDLTLKAGSVTLFRTQRLVFYVA